MRKTTFTSLFLIIWGVCFAQKENTTHYLAENARNIDLAHPDFQFDKEFYTNDLFFFGFIHGSEKPQILDLELLKTLYLNGVHHYAPEVDYSLAYFLNQYLITGNEDFLDYACSYYRSRVPQDASIQFKNKWKNLYKFNSQLQNKPHISIIGLDTECSKDLTLTHIAYIAPQEATGMAIVDSLIFFKALEKNDNKVLNKKPAYKSGKGLDYFFGTEKTSYYKRFVLEYEKDSLTILELFGEHAEHLKHLMTQPDRYNREATIFENFKKIGLPLIQKGEKIYANYGYFHIQQEKIRGNKSMAKLIKDNCAIKQVSIAGMLTKSECLKYRKYKSEGPLILKNTKFKAASYQGFTTSKSYDGDSLFEKINGIEILEKISKSSDCTLFKLNGKKSPFTNSMYFADFKRGGKNWIVEEDASTTDYFQYIILIKNSPPNIPLEEE